MILGILGWGICEWRFQGDLKEVSLEVGEEVLFVIEKGESARGIAERLSEKNLVVSGRSFLRFASREDLDGKLMAGRWVLKRNMTISEVALALSSDQAENIKVRLPEGFTLAQLDEWLAAKGVVKSGEILECAENCDWSGFSWVDFESEKVKQKLEGMLWPDTYFFDARSVNAEKIISRALLEMERKMNGLGIPESEWTSVMTMASLIEKEAWGDEEKKVISGVLWGRIEDGMRLDVDATVRYFVGKLREPLTREDLDLDDDFNTRKNWGMPPGPIGMFGIESLKAAWNPEKTGFRFYLHDENGGGVHFARSLEGHNVNVGRWLR